MVVSYVDSTVLCQTVLMYFSLSCKMTFQLPAANLLSQLCKGGGKEVERSNNWVKGSCELRNCMRPVAMTKAIFMLSDAPEILFKWVANALIAVLTELFLLPWLICCINVLKVSN